jgi:hypothetical protein
VGIYGAYGFDMAAIYGVPAHPTFLSFQIRRNYDGKLSPFGDTGVSAAVANPDDLSAFAALRSKNGALTVMVINKQTGSTPVTISLANFATSGTAQAYQPVSPLVTAAAGRGIATSCAKAGAGSAASWVATSRRLMQLLSIQ